MQTGKKIKEKTVITIIIALAILIAVFPIAMRELNQEGILPGKQAYKHFLLEEKTPYHILIGQAGNIETAAKLTAALSTIISSLLLYSILKALKLEIKNRFLTVLLFIITPAFIYTATIPTPYSLMLFLNLLAFRLYISKNKIIQWLGVLAYLTTAFFGIIETLVPIITITAYSVGKDKRKSMITTAALAIISLAYHLPRAPELHISPLPLLLKETITELGAMHGFGIFTLALAVVGIGATWYRKQKLAPLYTSAVILVLLSITLSNWMNIFINIPLTILAAQGLISIINKEWELKQLKTILIIALVCGLLFSTIAFTNRLTQMTPTIEIKDSLLWLRRHSQQNDKVLSYWEKSNWIKYYAGRPTITDEKNKQEILQNNLFYERSLKDTKQRLTDNEVKYIWIDKEMLEGQVWNKPEEGLLFLFRDTETFKKVFENNKTIIYYYKG